METIKSTTLRIFDLKQMWFLSDGSELDEEGKAKKWNIPILTATDQGIQSNMMIMRETTASITIPLSGPNIWVKLNASNEIMMRVLATPEMLKRMHVAIQTKQLGPIDRAGILNDTYAFVKAGHLSPTILIELICKYENEDEYVVWEGLSSALNGLDAVLSDDRQVSDSFRNFAKPLVLNSLKKMGWHSKANDGHVMILLRSTSMSLISNSAYDDEEVVAEVRAKVAKFLEDANDVENLPSDIRPQAFRIFLKNGGELEYNTIKSYFMKAETNAEQMHVLQSLGSTPDPKLKLSALEWSISGKIKLQNFHSLMGSVGASGNSGNDVCWQFYQDNFEKIQLFLGSGSSVNLSNATILACAGHFYTTEKANEINAFFETKSMPRNTRAISQMIENMRSNARFLNVLKSSELSSSCFWTNF